MVTITMNRSSFPRGNMGNEKFIVKVGKNKKTFVRANNSTSARKKIKSIFPSSKIKSRKINGTVFGFNVSK